MATVTRTLPLAPPAPRGDIEQRIVLFDIPWDTYLSLLKANGERPIRMSYDRGVQRFLDKYETMGENALIREFRRWVRHALRAE